jgi:hypothetical protein
MMTKVSSKGMMTKVSSKGMMTYSQWLNPNLNSIFSMSHFLIDSIIDYSRDVHRLDKDGKF